MTSASMRSAMDTPSPALPELAIILSPIKLSLGLPHEAILWGACFSRIGLDWAARSTCTWLDFIHDGLVELCSMSASTTHSISSEFERSSDRYRWTTTMPSASTNILDFEKKP